MRHTGDVYRFGSVIYGVDDPVITDADTPFVHAALSLHPRGRGVTANCSIRGTMREITAAGSGFNSFSALAANASR